MNAKLINTAEETPLVLTEGLIGKRTEQYIAIRDRRRALKKAYEEADKPLSEGENLLSAAIMRFFDENGIEQARTSSGTVFTTVRTTASLSDPDAFMKHVIETNAFELLDRKANATAVKDYVKEKGELPPGCNLNQFRSLNVHAKRS